MDLFNVSDAGMHWYCWHQIPFDTGENPKNIFHNTLLDYPQYFPPRQGFGSAVPILQKMGIRYSYSSCEIS